MAALTAVVPSADAEAVRQLLAQRVRLQVEVRRHWLFLRKVTAEGPADVIDAAKKDLAAWREVRWLDDQW